MWNLSFLYSLHHQESARFHSFRYTFLYFWKHVKYVVTYSRGNTRVSKRECHGRDYAYFRGVPEVLRNIRDVAVSQETNIPWVRKSHLEYVTSFHRMEYRITLG